MHPLPASRLLPLLTLGLLVAGGVGCVGRGVAPGLPPLPPVAILTAHPEAYRGHGFAFAAEIVAVVAAKDRSYIEVELLALDRRGRVEQPPHPIGRAFLRDPAPLDGSRYRPGREVVGSVRFADVATGTVGDEHHPYPILDLLDHRVVRDFLHRDRPRIRLQFQGGFGL